MNALSKCWSRGLVVCCCLALLAGVATAQSEETISEKTDITVTETEIDKCPATLDVTYSIYSDYVWRGVNRSEYAGEGREKPNHQVHVDLGIDIGEWVGEAPGTCGMFRFSTFLEWFAAQKKLNPIGGGQNLQEVEYTLAWSYDIEDWYTTMELGYIFWTYPNAKAGNTDEWFLSLDHNDAWMWKWMWADNEDGVLNPKFTLYHDVDASGGDAVWMELGFSHDFQLEDCPNVTITPSWTLGIDHNFYSEIVAGPTDRTTRFGNMLWGLDIAYDMTEWLRIPDGWGSVALTGSLYFSDALGNAEDSGVIQDEFFGGISLGYSF